MKRGCQANVFEGKRQKIRKERGIERKIEPKKETTMFSQKGLMKKKQRWNFEREDKRIRKGRPRRRNLYFEDRAFGGTKEKKPLKLQEAGLFWLFARKQKPKRQKPKPPSKKGEGLKIPFCILQQPTIFGKITAPMQLTPFFLQLLCFAERTIKRVFSAKHSFCVSQIVTPLLDTHSNNPLFGRRGSFFWTLPKFTVLPSFVVF